MRYIGKMLFSLREEKGISQKELSRGIISVPELSRIVSGSNLVDCLVLVALFQRLG